MIGPYHSWDRPKQSHILPQDTHVCILLLHFHNKEMDQVQIPIKKEMDKEK